MGGDDGAGVAGAIGAEGSAGGEFNADSEDASLGALCEGVSAEGDEGAASVWGRLGSWGSGSDMSFS